MSMKAIIGNNLLELLVFYCLFLNLTKLGDTMTFDHDMTALDPIIG